MTMMAQFESVHNGSQGGGPGADGEGSMGQQGSSA
jgi:hypothetical protein